MYKGISNMERDGNMGKYMKSVSTVCWFPWESEGHSASLYVCVMYFGVFMVHGFFCYF